MELLSSYRPTEFVVIHITFTDLFPKIIVRKMTYHLSHVLFYRCS